MSSPPSAKPSKAERAAAERLAYDTSVFINCPFDEGYRPLFYAAVFAVYDCGFVPRCAIEVYDSGQVRVDKIMTLIEACRYPASSADTAQTLLEAVKAAT